MAKSNGSPILIAGGGIGGLAAAYALARKGLPVRVLEQAPEFREIGAGIQLGPNVFNAFERLGLKDAVMADVHVPPAMEMRDALTGQAGHPDSARHARLHQPVQAALRGHPSPRHPRRLPAGLPGQQPDHAGEQPHRRRTSSRTTTASR